MVQFCLEKNCVWLARCLGPAKSHGNAMSQWILNINGQVQCVSTLRKLTRAEIDSETEREKRNEFTKCIKLRLGSSMSPAEIKINETPVSHPVDDPKIRDADDYEGLHEFDEYLGAEVLLPQNGEHMKSAKVVNRVLDGDGKPKGSINPILDTRIYEVMFPDGELRRYSANVIAENMYSQVDSEGYQYNLLDEIVSHRSTNEAIKKEEGWHHDMKGNKVKRFTTKGWYLNVQWKDGTQQWIPLKDLKESNPVELAEYAERNGLTEEPAFAWWVSHTLQKRDRIVASVNA